MRKSKLFALEVFEKSGWFCGDFVCTLDWSSVEPTNEEFKSSDKPQTSTNERKRVVATTKTDSRQISSPKFRYFDSESCFVQSVLRYYLSGLPSPWSFRRILRVGLKTIDVKILAFQCPRVAWQFRTPICFPTVKQALISEQEAEENHLFVWARCQKANGGIYLTKKWRWGTQHRGLELTIPNPALKTVTFKCISLLNGSVFFFFLGGGPPPPPPPPRSEVSDRRNQPIGISFTSQLAENSSVFTSIVHGLDRPRFFPLHEGLSRLSHVILSQPTWDRTTWPPNARFSLHS